VWREADASITHRHLRHVGVETDLEFDGAAAWRVLDGVRKQVREHLFEPLLVPVDQQRWLCAVKIVRKPLFARAGLQGFEGAPRHLDQVELLALELHFAMRDARDVQQVIDQPTQVARLPLDDRSLFGGSVTVELLVEQRDGKRDRSERVAQLVTQHCQKRVARFDCPASFILAATASNRRPDSRKHGSHADGPVEKRHVS
jgi:hypothetical protein